jgi:uncharacterized protein DUF3352
MRARLATLAALVLGLVLLAGCGGGGGKSTVSGGASVVPKSAVAFISFVTDRSSPQWQQALELVKRFPAARKALAQPKGKGALSAVGPEFDVAVLDLKSRGSDVVLLTQPRDAAKLNSAVSAGAVHTVVDGWTVYANDRATLKKFEAERSSGSLSDDKAFQDAYSDLPSDAIAKAWASGPVIEQRFRRSFATQSNLSLASPISSQSGKLASVSAALVPEQSGAKLHLNANGDLPGNPSTFSPELPAELPSGALAYVSFSNLESSFRSGLQQLSQTYPQFDALRAQLESMGGFSVDKDLLPLFGGEGAVAVYPGKKQPTIDAVFKISDEQAATKVLNGLSLLTRFSKGTKVSSAHGVWRISAPGSKTAISITVSNGLLIVTNQATSLAAIQNVSARLSEDPTYKAAVEGSALPAHTSGFVYVNVPLAARYELTTTARQSGRRVNPMALAQIAHLQGLLLYANKNGGNYELTGFLGVK